MGYTLLFILKTTTFRDRAKTGGSAVGVVDRCSHNGAVDSRRTGVEAKKVDNSAIELIGTVYAQVSLWDAAMPGTAFLAGGTAPRRVFKRMIDDFQ